MLRLFLLLPMVAMLMAESVAVPLMLSPEPSLTSSARAEAGTQGGALAQSVRSEDLVVMLTIKLGESEADELTLMYFSSEGNIPAGPDISIQTVYLDYGNVRATWQPAEAHEGHAVFRGDLLRHRGNWRIVAEIGRPRPSSPTRVVFEVSVP